MRIPTILALLLLAGNCWSFEWPWAKAAKKSGLELNAVKVSVAEQADALAKIAVEMGGLKAQVGNIETKVNAQAAAVAGVSNRVSSISAGRDSVQTTTNDTALMKEMVTAYKAIICLLIAQMVGLVVQMIVLVKYIAGLFKDIISEKEKMIDRERTSRERKEATLDAAQNKLIDKLTGKPTPGQREADAILGQVKKEEEKK